VLWPSGLRHHVSAAEVAAAAATATGATSVTGATCCNKSRSGHVKLIKSSDMCFK